MLKGRSCADGSTQRKEYEKAETASPTLGVEALFTLIMIVARERRHVITSDIAGAYLNAFMEDFVLMKLVGEVVDILCQLNPRYKQFVVIEKGRRVLYVRLNKALYGCVQSALLWYKMLSDAIKTMGFELNPYDPCVANAMINGAQCTIAWYVDDLIITHKDNDVVEGIVNQLEAKFGKMNVSRGQSHTYLGMDITFMDNGKAQIHMPGYIEDAIKAYEDDITGEATTPAQKNLFEVDEHSPPLSLIHI